jgi:hypothetical protein
LIVATILGIVLIFASFLPLMFSPMIFDAGETPWAWTMFIAVWLFPVDLLASLVVAWIAFAARAYRVVWIGAVLAALAPAVLVCLFVMSP